jgi:hypothetical protein
MSTKISLDLLSTLLPRPIDLFLCATSFEARSLSIARALPNHLVKKLIVFTDIEEFGPSSVIMADSIVSAYRDRASVIQYRVKDPLQIADGTLGALVREGFRGNVVVDVTTFTQEALLILLKAMQILNNSGVVIKGVYNSATDYGVGQSKERKWLTKGVSDLRSILGYSGTNRPTLGQHLIVLAGFELERAERTIDLYDPSLLSIGLGHPLESISPDLFDVNRWFHQRLMERYGGVQQFYFSCDDPIHTRDAILNQIRKNPEYNACIAPMNTKISTVGVGMAAMENSEIQICYAHPVMYNFEGYSKESANAYLFDINLPSRRENGA